MGFKLNKIYTFEAVEQIRERLKSVTFNAGDKMFNVTATFGISFNNGSKDLHRMIVSADEKLYLGKENGRDRIEV